MSYENPQEFFICLDDSHDANYDIMDSKDTRCSFCGKPGAIKYYYLGVPQKVKLWCSFDTFRQEMVKFLREELVDNSVLDKRLQALPWTIELKDWW